MKKINHKIIIVAGGIGSRMGNKIPKQFIEIKEKPIIFYAIEQFLKYDSSIEFVISLHPNYVDYWHDLLKKHSFNFNHKIALGGTERFYSVKNALELIPDNCIVGIHDSVRPFVSQETIKNCFETAIKNGSAIPVIDSINSLRKQNDGKSHIINREEIKIVQTPQYFESKHVKESYLNEYMRKFTDDASVYEFNNNEVNLVKGNVENIKITSPIDLIFGESIIEKTKLF